MDNKTATIPEEVINNNILPMMHAGDVIEMAKTNKRNYHFILGNWKELLPLDPLTRGGQSYTKGAFGLFDKTTYYRQCSFLYCTNNLFRPVLGSQNVLGPRPTSNIKFNRIRFCQEKDCLRAFCGFHSEYNVNMAAERNHCNKCKSFLCSDACGVKRGITQCCEQRNTYVRIDRCPTRVCGPCLNNTEKCCCCMKYMCNYCTSPDQSDDLFNKCEVCTRPICLPCYREKVQQLQPQSPHPPVLKEMLHTLDSARWIKTTTEPTTMYGNHLKGTNEKTKASLLLYSRITCSSCAAIL